MFGIAVLVLAFAIALKISPKEHHEAKGEGKHSHIQTAGQIGLLGAVALFGVDYFTSFFYATGEMMHVLEPMGLQQYAWMPIVAVALINVIFGGLYIYSLGIFNEGGGSYTASMRYLAPMLSLIVAVTLIEDYVLTIVVSALSGADQFLSIQGFFDKDITLALFGASFVIKNWVAHFGIGAILAAATWFITIRGRGESARTVFALLAVFGILTTLMVVGLVHATLTHAVAPMPAEPVQNTPSLGDVLFHLLGASMKGLVALTGLEAMSNGIQFVKDEDSGIVKWGKQHFPQWERLWKFYSGKVGIGRMVQSSFLFYGGLTTAIAGFFAVHFNVFDGTAGRTLIGNLSFIGFSVFPNGDLIYGAYQLLSVLLLAAASMTAFQDVQATEWRDVAIGEIPEFVCYRDPKGTFTRSVTVTFIVTVIIMLIVGGNTTHAIPFYGVGVFLPIAIMGWAVRRHILATAKTARMRRWGSALAGAAAVISGFVFLNQIFARWEEGGWVRLISFTLLFSTAHLILISGFGRRTPESIERIVRQKARVQGAMAEIVEWQSLRMQEYRYHLRRDLKGLLNKAGVQADVEPVPVPAGPYPVHLHDE